MLRLVVFFCEPIIKSQAYTMLEASNVAVVCVASFELVSVDLILYFWWPEAQVFVGHEGKYPGPSLAVQTADSSVRKVLDK